MSKYAGIISRLVNQHPAYIAGVKQRSKWLIAINKALKPLSIKITCQDEVIHPVEGCDISYVATTLFVLQHVGLLRGWQVVAAIVCGENGPQVKDGSLPEGISLKIVSASEWGVPDYYSAHTVGVLHADGTPVAAIMGNKVQVRDLGEGVTYNSYPLKITCWEGD